MCVCALYAHVSGSISQSATPPKKSTCQHVCQRVWGSSWAGAGLHRLPPKPLWGIIFFPMIPGLSKLSNNSTLPFSSVPPYPSFSHFPSLPLSFHSFLSFSHYQGVACDWQMGTNNNFFFRNLRPSSVIGLPADISKPHSPPAAPTTPPLNIGPVDEASWGRKK